MKERKVRAKIITLHRKNNLQYYDISAESNYNFEKPIPWFAWKFLGDTNVVFTEIPALLSPEEEMNPETREKVENELREAQESV